MTERERKYADRDSSLYTIGDHVFNYARQHDWGWEGNHLARILADATPGRVMDEIVATLGITMPNHTRPALPAAPR